MCRLRAGIFDRETQFSKMYIKLHLEGILFLSKHKVKLNHFVTNSYFRLRTISDIVSHKTKSGKQFSTHIVANTLINTHM